MIKMTVCPACRRVHERGGRCLLSRHHHLPILAIPALAVNAIPLGFFFQSRFFSNLNTAFSS
jgi:hypothetical protein